MSVEHVRKDGSCLALDFTRGYVWMLDLQDSLGIGRVKEPGKWFMGMGINPKLVNYQGWSSHFIDLVAAKQICDNYDGGDLLRKTIQDWEDQRKRKLQSLRQKYVWKFM